MEAKINAQDQIFGFAVDISAYLRSNSLTEEEMKRVQNSDIEQFLDYRIGVVKDKKVVF
jgi:hypothetical protein